MTSLTNSRWPSVTIYFGASFLLNLLWENLHAPLYAGFTSFEQHFWICFKATWGDLLMMFMIFGALSIVHRDLLWITDKSTYANPATWVITLLLGILLAVSFELWAVYVDHRWQYTEMMPLIPIIQIGLTPVLQMLLIPFTVLFLTSRSSRSV